MAKRHKWGKKLDDQDVRYRGSGTTYATKVRECVNCGLRKGYSRYCATALYFDDKNCFLSWHTLPYTCSDIKKTDFLFSEDDFLI